MEKKSLKNKAIDIKGKKYVLVSDRIIYFNEIYENGMINSDLISYENGRVLIKCTITPDAEKPNRFFTGYSQEIDGSTFINKTSALENAETSAVGRALAMMGIGVIDTIASVDEVNKAKNRPEGKKSLKPEDVTKEIYAKLPAKSKEAVKNYYCKKLDVPFLNEKDLLTNLK